ncbi:hypothetical protein HMPREF0569_0498 [Micrococcus luteus SK58]|uniref:phage tail tube protein n=1 Tax=Micrococcus luteus TaxID=1270 RepID=UPI0001C4FFF6|nr:hypothetical protein [Micrococcus luteus]EFD50355.1 hypothetical protein HMPREF0569_1608 [Micrococcus luteus SK58]EFD50772.1 hypothetical protein HMPREF0569_0498 [Micrococcus luteus SK58]
MAGTEIPSTPADGNMLVLDVPAIADVDKPTIAELTASSAVDLSCYLTGDGWSPSKEQASIADERLCSTETFERPGRKTRSLEVTYIDNTNSPYETEFNKAVDTLVEGTDHYLVTRRGVPYEEPLAVGQVVEIWPVTAGEQREVAIEANSVTRTVQKLFVRGPVRRAVVAA